MALIDRLLKNSTIKHTALIKDSKVFGKKEVAPTDVPLINTALGGSLNGGVTPGLLTIAGPSRHFKSAFALILASAYLKKYPDAFILFYDSEFGSPESYFKAFDVDMDRVIHTPIRNVEELKFDIVAQLEGLEKGDHVFILIDSIGNLASKKEVEDAKDQKSVADMSRAKALKSLWRIVTPELMMKDLPLVNVNHTYKEIGLYPKDIVSGGTGGIYSSDAIWIVGRAQEKDGTDLSGYKFTINIEKSRHVKEKSKLPITVSFDGGVKKWSGMLDLAQDGGFVAKPSRGWYQQINPETGEFLEDKKKYREAELLDNDDFWNEIFDTTNFAQYIEKRFKLVVGEGEDNALGHIDELVEVEDE